MQSGWVTDRLDDGDGRRFRDYLDVLRSSPGFGVRVAAAAVFGLALALDKGPKTLAFVVLAVVALAVLVIYPIFRRKGPGPWH